MKGKQGMTPDEYLRQAPYDGPGRPPYEWLTFDRFVGQDGYVHCPCGEILKSPLQDKEHWELG